MIKLKTKHTVKHFIKSPNLKISIAGSDNPSQPRNGQGNASLVFLGIPLDQSLNQRRSSGHHTHVLVVQQVDDAGSPFAARDDVGVGAEQPQKAQCGGLFYHVQGVTAEGDKNWVFYCF